MQRSHFTNRLKTAVIGTLVLLLGATLAVAQQQVNLTAGPATATLPDGSSVPMWGYSCGAAVTGSTATCAKANPSATGWSPVVITVPSGQGLQINLTNNLSFNGNNIPTSIVIAGQLGGGLGGVPQRIGSPQHENLSTTWPIANTGPVFVPPSQPDRVQSFATEVQGTPATTVPQPAATALKWNNLRSGTYLLESGTHPSIQVPMGLIGMVVVTCAPGDTSGCTAGTAYPNVTYNADIPLLFSEIDPTQNKSVTTAVNTVGFSESATLGPYSKQPLGSVNLVNGGSGYTSAPTVSLIGGGCSSDCGAVTATIDTDNTSPTYQQVVGLNFTPGKGLYTSIPTVSFSGGAGSGAAADVALQLAASNTCSGGATACYPPAVNYTPLYYLINGQSFDKTNPGNSRFAVPGTVASPGSVLVRIVNAGLRMHVPSIVGAQTGSASPAAAGFSLIAEDGNPLPGIPRVQSEVFMAAGKTYDVMINVPAPPPGAAFPSLPVYDRELSLSGNSTTRDAGMLAYISVNGAGLPVAANSGVLAVKANADTYSAVIPGKTLTISDPTKGVLANDVNVYNVSATTLPTKGTLTLNPNGTFTYVAGAGWSGPDSFGYCGNGATSGAACATVTLSASALTNATVACNSNAFAASNAKYLAIKTPGVLANCTDSQGLPLTVIPSTIAVVSGSSTTTGTVIADANGGFTATAGELAR